MFFLSVLNKVYLQLEHRTYWKSTLWTLHYAPFKVSLLEGVISLESSEMFLNRYEPNAERVSKLSLPLYSVLQKNKSREVFYILERCPWSLNAWVLKQYQGFYPKTDILQLPYRRSQPFSTFCCGRTLSSQSMQASRSVACNKQCTQQIVLVGLRTK